MNNQENPADKPACDESTQAKDAAHSRDAFEGWISVPPYERSIERQGENGSWPGQYRSYETQAAWEAWQEARQTDPDAARYRKLRAIAMQQGSLEAFVAIGQLDYISTREAFDQCVDAQLAEWLQRGPHQSLSARSEPRS